MLTIPAVLFAALALHHHHPHHHPPRLGPMAQVAHTHHWNHTQTTDAWAVLYIESTSTPAHVNLDATNGNCVGAAQLAGGWNAYYRYGGNPNTVLGQLEAFADYITERYGLPSAALAHEHSAGWY